MSNDIFSQGWGEVKISVVRNAQSTETQTQKLGEIMRWMRERKGNYQQTISDIRETDDKDEQGELKRTLPAAMFSGTFSRRSAKNLEQHSGILCLDFDRVENLEAKRNLIEPDEHVIAVFVSPSGTGLKVLVAVPAEPENHAKIFRQAADYFKGYKLDADESGKDVSRLCFLSHDPHLYYNPDAYELQIVPDDTVPSLTAREEATTGSTCGDRIGDRYNTCADIRQRSAAILEGLGWKVIRRSCDQEWWTRPGKERGVSGTLWSNGSFYCFTDSAPPLSPTESYSAFSLYATAKHSGDFSAAAKALVEELGDPNPHISGRDYFGKVVPDTASDEKSFKAVKWPQKKVGQSKRPKNRKEEILKRPPVLLDGLLHKGDIGIIGGVAKAGKTIFAMNMAVSLAKGESFLRWESAKEKYKVLYLDFELAEWMIDERINAITKFGCPENLTTVCFQQLPDLANLSSLKKYVKEELAQDQYDLIIWDCLYRFIGNRDENSNADMAEVFGWFQGFRTITGATQLIIHHFGKGDHSGKSVNDCFRGASAISGAVDSAVALSAHEEKDHFIVKQISRGFAQQDPFVVHWKYPKFEVTEKDPSKHRRPGAEQKVSDGEIVDYVTCLNRPTDAKSIGEALQLTQQQAKPRLDGLVLQRLLNATKGRPRKYTAAKSRMKETL